MIEFKVIEIVDSEHYFKGVDFKDRVVKCYFNNPIRDWSKIYSYLNKTIKVKGSLMTANSFVVMEIIE